jgi:hypothetical protein
LTVPRKLYHYRLEGIIPEKRGSFKAHSNDANICVNTLSKNPLEKLAKAWETLTPGVQAKIAEFVEQATGKA